MLTKGLAFAEKVDASIDLRLRVSMPKYKVHTLAFIWGSGEIGRHKTGAVEYIFYDETGRIMRYIIVLCWFKSNLSHQAYVRGERRYPPL